MNSSSQCSEPRDHQQELALPISGPRPPACEEVVIELPDDGIILRLSGCLVVLRTEKRVASEQLVGALSAHDGAAARASDLPAQQEPCDPVRVELRRLAAADGVGEIVGEVAIGEPQHVGASADQARGRPRDRRLVVTVAVAAGRVVEADRERRHRAIGMARHDPQHGRRIEATAQQAADRRIPAHPQPHALVDQVPRPRDARLLREPGIDLVAIGARDVPVAFDARTIVRDGQRARAGGTC